MKLTDDHLGHRLRDPGLQKTQETPGQVWSPSTVLGQAWVKGRYGEVVKGQGMGRWSPPNRDSNRYVDLLGTWD